MIPAECRKASKLPDERRHQRPTISLQVKFLIFSFNTQYTGQLLLAIMAAAHVTTRSILSSFLPRLSTSTASRTTRFTTLYSRQLALPLVPAISFSIPSAIHLNVPGLLEGLWESILKAVPKKKTSHSKKRSRQMAGKGLKDVTALNRCSACGHVKRAHLLCPYCVAGKLAS